MVRLKETDIPLCRLREVFQFHYGTIKSRQTFYPTQVANYFNSTMVRLKDYEKVLLLHLQRISIPLWYD